MARKIQAVLIIAALVLTACRTEVNYRQAANGVIIPLTSGTLGIYPMADNAVRIKFFEGKEMPVPDFVFIGDSETPEFEVVESAGNIRVSLKDMLVEVSLENGGLAFMDHTGKTILNEKAGSRIVRPDSVMGEPCYFVEQSFHSPADEYIFGLGQFQDGNYNLKGVARRLTQVNSQIAIPFIYSNKGYGLLWNQYGLTDFNPTDNFITLEKQELGQENDQVAEATTTTGTQKVSQNQSLYQGVFSVPEDGEYALFLDLGAMGNRHYVAIDGEPVIDQRNTWLPPTAGKLARLKAGEHNVQVICKSDNQPKLAWRVKEDISTFRSPNAKKLDYVVFAGSADEVIASYRNLTGNAPMLPEWAYGYWQCRERYTSSDHLIETVKEFRSRDIPMDVIVQDWQYWGNKGWGVPQFDEARYPDPPGFIKTIHDQNAHFCVSIWSNPDKNSTLGQEYVANKRFIPGTKWLDYFNPETRKEYWATLKENMFDHGVDAWWMDAIEPENDALKGERTHIGLGDFYRLIYPLMVSKAVYEGQRKVTDDKRVCILTRSAFSGQQRYGAINWSGDVGGDWDAYRRQIPAGLNFVITGLPYWTTDIGGFFRPGSAQYSDEGYHELLTRWFQWGAFSPIFRMHGYQSETEPWKYGAEVEANMRKMLDLRYRLIPYIYSEAWKISNQGSTIMRPLVMDFPEDVQAVSQPHQYMFGQSFLVAPVTEPGIKEMQVYLPESPAWFDFWTGKQISGGQTVNAPAPLDKIPLFVKAGSIVPMGKFIQFTREKPADTLEIRIYSGANGNFELYEDEGDNYNYEEGACSIIPFDWNEQTQTLTIEKRKGGFDGMIKERIFKVVWVNELEGKGIEMSEKRRPITYRGERIEIKK